MCQLPRPRQKSGAMGMSLLEVLIAIAILSIGLMAGALLMSTTFKTSVRSRYVAEAAQLASEKLEDLGRLPSSISKGVVYPEAHIFVPSGQTCQLAASTGANCVGSIAPALTCAGEPNCTFNPVSSVYTPLSITSNEAGAGGTVSPATLTATIVDYTDAVYLSAGNGIMQETYQTSTGASPTFATLTFGPNGQIPTVTATAPGSAQETFDRRWVIEQDQPIAGVRRITVLITLMDLTVQPPVTYQMSMVRP